MPWTDAVIGYTQNAYAEAYRAFGAADGATAWVGRWLDANFRRDWIMGNHAPGNPTYDILEAYIADLGWGRWFYQSPTEAYWNMLAAQVMQMKTDAEAIDWEGLLSNSDDWVANDAFSDSGDYYSDYDDAGSGEE